MDTTITSLDNLDADLVEQNQVVAAQLLQERYPRMELRRGVIFDNVLAPHAMLATVHQSNYDLLRQSQSLAAIQADPEAVDDILVDALASNYLITRRAGQYAGGHLLVVIDQLVSVTIAAGTVFAGSGKQFATPSAFTARTAAAALATTTDRLLTPLSDGTYGFIIDVTAAAEGADSRIAKDTLCTPVVVLPYFVKAYAAEDFVGGISAETNAELATRLAAGAAAKAFSGRLQMSASLRAAYPEILSDSIVGFGDSEMVRDRHGIFPGSSGGRADWYVRTQQQPQRVTLTKSATLVDRDIATGKGVWQLNLVRDDASGFYDAIQILRNTDIGSQGTYAIIEETISLDLSDLTAGELIPDIVDAEEAAYSRFSTRILRFLDTDTSITSLTIGQSRQDYTVTMRRMPELDLLQTFAASRSRCNYGGDILVKAAIPCFLRVSLTMYVPAGVTAPDTTILQTALAAAVIQNDFTGKLSASYLAGVIYSQFDDTQRRIYLGAIDMFGQLRKPDQSLQYLRATDILTVPSDGMTSPRTVAFILEPADVAISVVTADTPAV